MRHTVFVDGGFAFEFFAFHSVAKVFTASGIVVFDPAEVVECKAALCARNQHLILVSPSGKCTRLIVEHEFKVGIANVVAGGILDNLDGRSIGSHADYGQLGIALLQHELFFGHRITGLGPGGGFLQHSLHVQAVFLAIGHRGGVRQVDEALRTSSCRFDLNRSGFHFLAVLKYRVLQFQMLQVVEVVGILNGQCLLIRLEIKEFHKLVNLFDLCHFGRPGTIGRHQTIVDKVLLVIPIAVVVAGAVFGHAVRSERTALDVGSIVNRLVDQVPDATANTILRFFDGIPVFLEVADGITHSMSVFAHEVGLTAPVVVGIAFSFTHCGIHHTPQVRVVGIAARSSFVVNDTRVELLGQVVSRLEVVARSAFVTQAPEHDRGEVAVAHYHAAHAVFVHGLSLGVTRNSVAAIAPVVVAFDVGFVHAVKSVIVEHGIHFGLAGIVAATHNVHVGLLHDLHVAQHGGHIDGTSVKRVGILRIGTFEEHAASVDVHLAVLQFHLAETIFRGESHFFLSALVGLRHFDGVEVGIFARPVLQASQPLELHIEGLNGVAFGKAECSTLFGHFRTVGGQELDVNRFFHGQLRGIGHFELHVHVGLGHSSAEIGSDVVVAHVGFRGGVDVDVAVNTTHAPHVLSFEIRTVGEADNLYRHVVFAFAYHAGNVEFGIVVRTFGIAHILSVDPH